MSKVILKIINGDNKDEYYELSKREALDLELKLNVSKNGKVWRNIGDILFIFQATANTNDELVVTQQQFEYLSMLLGKDSWSECYNV
jgi:hypothetical protein